MKSLLPCCLVFSWLMAASAFAAEAVQPDTMLQVKGFQVEMGDPGLLPASPFYFLKEWRRSFQRVLKFSPAAKAKLELKIADERTAEFVKLSEVLPQNEKAKAAMVRGYERSHRLLRGQITRLRPPGEDPAVDKIFDDIALQTARHERIFEKFESSDIVKTIKEELEETREALVQKDEPHKYAERLERAFIEVNRVELARASGTVAQLRERAEEQIRHAEEAIQELEEALRAVLDADQLEACLAKCRDTYGGSGSAEYDACVRQCNAGGAQILREQACPGDRAIACEVPKIPECHNGKWICVPPATGGSPTGGRIGAPAAEQLLLKAKDHLERSKKAFADKNYGEAFGLGHSAEALARNGLAILTHESRMQGLDAPEKEFTSGKPSRLDVELFFDRYNEGYRSYLLVQGVNGGAFFKEVSGLDVAIETTEYQEGGKNDGNVKLPGQTGDSSTVFIVLQNGITKSKAFVNWLQQSRGKEPQRYRKNISIIILTGGGKVSGRYDFRNAWPAEWSPPVLDARNNSYTIEEVKIKVEREVYSPRPTGSPVKPGEPTGVCPQLAPACGNTREECLLAAKRLEERYQGCNYASACEVCTYKYVAPSPELFVCPGIVLPPACEKDMSSAECLRFIKELATIYPRCGFEKWLEGVSVSPLPTPTAFACPDIYTPVCGTNDKTYSNACYAKAAGVAVKYEGECQTTSECGPKPVLESPPYGCKYDGPYCTGGKWNYSLICPLVGEPEPSPSPTPTTVQAL